MYSSTTEDIEGSNEDLIPTRNSENPFGYAQLHLGADETESGNAPFSVVFSHSPKKVCKNRFKPILVIILLIIVILCVTFVVLYVTRKCSQSNLKSDEYCTTAGCVDAASFMQNAMDPTANPCNDFYQFACGGWIREHPIPTKLSRWGVDSVLASRNLNSLKRLMETKAKNARKDNGQDAEMKAATFYKACMDEKQREKNGGKPLIDLLKKLDEETSSGERDKSNLLRKMLEVYNRNFSFSAFFDSFVEVDARNSSNYAIQIKQSGLWLPEANYNANMTDKVLIAYLEYMTKVHMLLGATNITKTKDNMRMVLDLEKNLSKIFVPRENMTEIDKNYKKMTIKQLQVYCPMIDWLKFYKNVFNGVTEITSDQDVIVLSLPYMIKLANLVKRTPSKVLFLYVHWRMISEFSPFLSNEFIDAMKDIKIALYGTVLQQERWKDCVRATDNAIGFALGAMFVKELFPLKSRSKVLDMVQDLRRAFIENLPNVDWMDEKTRTAAKGKAEAVEPKIGFPEEILQPAKLNKMYAKVNFTDKEYFANIVSSLKFKTSYSLQLLPRKVDKNMWYMTPSTVNAYYDPTRNQIVFPAGILQPPYFDSRYPRSVNYGGIGAVIGHELLHGFDNDGRLYDKNGNSGKLWWTEHSVREFRKKEICFIDEYSNYTVYSKHVNGKITLGENIADNGGLAAAYRAYKKWTKENGKEKLLPGIARSNEQVFFISFGQSWCTSARAAATLAQLNTDTHSPPKDRVLGSVSNSKEFANAFGCSVGSPYNPIKKCKIW